MGQKAKGFLCILAAFLITLIPIFDVQARTKQLDRNLEVKLHDAYWWRADANICANKNSTTDGSNVTIIGDSITEITSGGHTVNGSHHPDNHNDTNDFAEYLPEAEIYAQWGKSFWTDDGNNGGEGGKLILDRLAAEGSLREIVVYALGTNNANSLTAEMIQDVINTIGEEDHTIVFMTMSENGNPFTHNNALVEEAARSSDAVVIADWASAAGANPSLYFDQSDPVHPSIHEGTKLFAETIYGAISCSNTQTDTTIDCGMSGENTNYAGDQVFSESELQAIKENYPFYKAAADAAGIPWEVLAVIHSMEHGLQRDNPSNGQGAYQLYSYVQANGQFLPAGPLSDAEFQRQSNIAAEFIANKARGLDLSVGSGIKKLFFLYNGAASAYKNQARALGYSEEEAANGEGSPYVMNRFDAKRDPTAGASNWGQIKTDGGGLVYPANSGFGAYVKYLAISGSCAASSGGISVDEANSDGSIMSRYRALAKNTAFKGSDGPIVYAGCTGGTYNNCSAFTAWFINNYTNGSKVSNFQGSQFVKKLLNSYPSEYTDGGKTPAVGAIMSTGPNSGSADGWANHTGVVLGIDVANDIITIGEASCHSGFNNTWPNAHNYSLSKYTNNPSPYGPTYAYPNTFKGF